MSLKDFKDNFKRVAVQSRGYKNFLFKLLSTIAYGAIFLILLDDSFNLLDKSSDLAVFLGATLSVTATVVLFFILNMIWDFETLFQKYVLGEKDHPETTETKPETKVEFHTTEVPSTLPKHSGEVLKVQKS